jgi:CRP-like cAMP-binding protein
MTPDDFGDASLGFAGDPTLLNDEVEMLRQVPIFARIKPTKLKLLAFASERKNYSSGQELFRQGDAGDAAYVVLSGTADVLVNSGGKQIKVAEVGAHAVIGEIAVLSGGLRTASVRATSPMEVLRITKEHFLEMVNDFPDVALEIMRVLAARLTQTTAELTAARARDRSSEGQGLPGSLSTFLETSQD